MLPTYLMQEITTKCKLTCIWCEAKGCQACGGKGYCEYEFEDMRKEERNE